MWNCKIYYSYSLRSSGFVNMFLAGTMDAKTITLKQIYFFKDDLDIKFSIALSFLFKKEPHQKQI